MRWWLYYARANSQKTSAVVSVNCYLDDWESYERRAFPFLWESYIDCLNWVGRFTWYGSTIPYLGSWSVEMKWALSNITHTSLFYVFIKNMLWQVPSGIYFHTTMDSLELLTKINPLVPWVVCVTVHATAKTKQKLRHNANQFHLASSEPPSIRQQRHGISFLLKANKM